MNQGWEINLGNENIAPEIEYEDHSNVDEPMDLSPKHSGESSTDTNSDGSPPKMFKKNLPVSRTARSRKNKIAARKRRSNLPKPVVDILSEWLEQNKYNAYPSEFTKQEMATKMGITVKQVNNWFINARRRKLDHLLSGEGKCACDYRITRKKKACPVSHQARKTAVKSKLSYPAEDTCSVPPRPIQTLPTSCCSTSPSIYDSSTEESVFEFRPISPIQRERTLDFDSL